MKRSVALVLVIISLCSVAVAENWIFCNNCGANHESGGPCYVWNYEATEESEVVSWEEATEESEVVSWEEVVEEPEVDQNDMSYGRALLNRAAACNHEWQTFTSPMGVEGNMQIFYNQNYCPKCTLRGEFWESSEPVVKLPDFGSQTDSQDTTVTDTPEIQEQPTKNNNLFKILGAIILLGVIVWWLACKIGKACRRFLKKRNKAKRKNRSTNRSRGSEELFDVDESEDHKEVDVLKVDEIRDYIDFDKI